MDNFDKILAKPTTVCYQEGENDESMKALDITIEVEYKVSSFIWKYNENIDKESSALESRTTQIQEGEDDEDITLSDTTKNPPLHMHGSLITKAPPNLRVSSFLIVPLCIFKNILLPNKLIIVRNHGDDDETCGEELGGVEGQQGHANQVGGPIQVGLESVSEPRSSLH